jgi:aspartate/methionine/tyrosine aminotransferase
MTVTDPRIRSAVQALPGSRIREVANAAMGRSDVLAFWFGESDEVTPQAIRDAAVQSLAAGETFYSHNLGLASLRDALAGYVGSLHPAVSPGRLAVTSSGVTALMLAMQLLVDAGDEVLAVTPVWPNLTAQPAVLGARVTRLPLGVEPGTGRWTLDLQRTLDAVTPRTRVLLLNAPNNPTGWTLSRAEQEALLSHCRRTGTWIVADEVYERLYYAPSPNGCAPSFLDICDAHDRVIVAHSFSKSFLMTGWRLGWLVLPDGLADQAAKLIEFSSSCAPVFVQRAGEAALQVAADFVPALQTQMRERRDQLVGGLQQIPGIRVAVPDGGMYAFFAVEGQPDSLAFAKQLVRDHGLGIAPGVAFGPEGEGWLRWCFASREAARLDAGLQRLRQALGR